MYSKLASPSLQCKEMGAQFTTIMLTWLWFYRWWDLVYCLETDSNKCHKTYTTYWERRNL